MNHWNSRCLKQWYADQGEDVIISEYSALSENETGELVLPPEGKSMIGET